MEGLKPFASSEGKDDARGEYLEEWLRLRDQISALFRTEKGLVVRDESQRAHIYEARYSEQKTQRQLLTDLMERAFGGSPAKLVMQALSSSRRTSAEELIAIRELLDRMEGDKK